MSLRPLFNPRAVSVVTHTLASLARGGRIWPETGIMGFLGRGVFSFSFSLSPLFWEQLRCLSCLAKRPAKGGLTLIQVSRSKMPAPANASEQKLAIKHDISKPVNNRKYICYIGAAKFRVYKIGLSFVHNCMQPSNAWPLFVCTPSTCRGT